MKSILSASILSANFANLAAEIHAAEEAGVDWIHIDVMDGIFVPNITMGPFIVEHCRKITALPLDVHLMIIEPERHIKSFADAGADHLTVQVETCPHLYKTLQSIRELDVKAGVAVNPATPLNTLQYSFEVIDMILVMTVNPGYSGQVYIPEMTQKIAECKKKLVALGHNIPIEIDGGVTTQNIAAARSAGADVFVAATSIFKTGKSIGEAVQALRKAAG